MGKRIIPQRRGRNKGRFNVPSHRHKGEIKYPLNDDIKKGIVKDIFHDIGHTAPLAKVRFEKGETVLMPATEGIKVGDEIKVSNNKNDLRPGNILPLEKISEGAPIYNIEMSFGDGGKLVRSAGNNAVVVSHTGNKTVVQLPSGKFKTIDSQCRATIGVTAGGGRGDKPFLKAGKKYRLYKSKGRLYPTVRGVAMNAVSHPHGGGGHQHVGKPSTVSRNAPPGRKVGSIAAKKTGRGR